MIEGNLVITGTFSCYDDGTELVERVKKAVEACFNSVYFGVTVDMNSSEISVNDPSGGDRMTLDQFIEVVRKGYFDEYDGSAYYATATEVMTDPVDFSTLIAGHAPRYATHVVWYNK